MKAFRSRSLVDLVDLARLRADDVVQVLGHRPSPEPAVQVLEDRCAIRSVGRRVLLLFGNAERVQIPARAPRLHRAAQLAQLLAVWNIQKLPEVALGVLVCISFRDRLQVLSHGNRPHRDANLPEHRDTLGGRGVRPLLHRRLERGEKIRVVVPIEGAARGEPVLGFHMLPHVQQGAIRAVYGDGRGTEHLAHLSVRVLRVR
mmetsp:Transcript_7755/g.22068  ORF Transcript_7755/g.22068 Transcript_7755/m.22068 type:complete len:202 (+) Transcript_7755:55-660(+)